MNYRASRRSYTDDEFFSKLSESNAIGDHDQASKDQKNDQAQDGGCLLLFVSQHLCLLGGGD